MANTTKRPGAAQKLRSTGANKTAGVKPASGNATPTKAPAAKAASAKMAMKSASHILPAADGPRTVSHRKIKQAVEKVFRERSQTRA